jgi:ribosomal protein S18 acetylase RimI-like enzyme
MTLAVTIREALPVELDAAGEIVVLAYGTLPEPRHPEYLASIRDAARRARHCSILVAIDTASGELLGSVSYVPDNRNPYAELERDGEAGFRMLGVAPEARGRGIGEALVRTCIARAQAAGRSGIAISTSPRMEAAHRLYERLGFQRDPHRDHEPVPGVRLWAYVLSLADEPIDRGDAR